ncbi:MAG: nucleotidyl transferase AbiEii/AbiGii toxin family protein [Anaerolineales bacterium]|nr:nucleotidyl transferase AbiEii/AbiGii toxin family protein [Anaerolineales bacterium]
MLDRAKHEIVLKNILLDIYRHPVLQAQLAFKGGTCLYLFYDIPRFSTDLDFSLISGVKESDVKPDILHQIFSEYVTIREFTDKRFTWFWSGNYEKGMQNIKLEVSKRHFPDSYTLQDYLGITVRTLDLATMFAHKVCAVTDRRQMVNRDLYDTWWLLKQIAPIREEIIVERTGLKLPEYLTVLLEYIETNIDKRHIVSGLGELLDRPHKDWIRDHLYDDLIVQIKLRMQAESRDLSLHPQ